jgi:hypothetical protein
MQAPRGTRQSAGIRHHTMTFRLEHLPDRLVTPFRVTLCLGIGHAPVQQPGVQFVIALDPQPRREEAFPHQTDLVLDLPLLPADAGLQATGSTR